MCPGNFIRPGVTTTFISPETLLATTLFLKCGVAIEPAALRKVLLEEWDAISALAHQIHKSAT